MSQQDRLDELNVVELPLLRQLGAMGWTHVEGAEEDCMGVARANRAAFGP